MRIRHMATVITLILLQACAYRMPFPIPPKKEKLRIVSDRSTEFIVRIDEREYKTGINGAVIIDLPSARGTCSIYLLNIIEIKGNHFTPRMIVFESKGKEVFRIEAGKLKELPADEQGYRILKVQQQ